MTGSISNRSATAVNRYRAEVIDELARSLGLGSSDPDLNAAHSSEESECTHSSGPGRFRPRAGRRT